MNDNQANMIKSILKRNTEHSIQVSFFATLAANANEYPILNSKLIFAVPNGEKRDKITGARLKAQGVKRGIADVVVLIPNGVYNYLVIEFKEPTGKGRLSDEQKQFKLECEYVNGRYAVTNNYHNAIKILNEYLNIQMKCA